MADRQEPDSLPAPTASIGIQNGASSSPSSRPNDMPALEEAKDVEACDEAKSRSWKWIHFLAVVAGLPCQLWSFVMSMYRKFGGYVPAAMLAYGINQGLGGGLAGMARVIFFADVLGIDGATSGRLSAIGSIPWSMKPIFGMLSDALPLCGYHRSNYLVLAGIFGSVAATSLGLLPLTAIATVPFMILGNISVAIPDIIIDAKTAELCKEAPEHASDLQSLNWGSAALGGLVAAVLSGWLVQKLQPTGLFLLLNVAALSVLIPGALRMLPEQKLPRGQRGPKWNWFRKNGMLTGLAAYMTLAAVTVSLMQAFVDDTVIRAIVTVVCALVLILGVFLTLCRVAPVLGKTAAYLFLRSFVQPGFGDAMFQWLKNSAEGPRFSTVTLGLLAVPATLGFFLALVLYNKFFTRTSYRKIFASTQLISVAINMVDLVLVKRWNLRIGLPDGVMLIGDAAVSAAIGSFNNLPMFVLAAKVCPDEVEGTLFALLMALNNFGNVFSDFFGSSLLEVLGVVKGNWEKLPEAVVIRALCRLLPLLLIPFLVPALSPSDPIPLDAKNSGTGSASSTDDSNVGTGQEEGDQGEAVVSESTTKVEDVTASTDCLRPVHL